MYKNMKLQCNCILYNEDPDNRSVTKENDHVLFMLSNKHDTSSYRKQARISRNILQRELELKIFLC